jgi:hypothetical protein
MLDLLAVLIGQPLRPFAVGDGEQQHSQGDDPEAGEDDGNRQSFIEPGS